MPRKEVKIEDDELITKDNYKKCALMALERYSKKNLIADLFFWRHIIGLYENEIDELKEKVKKLEEKS